MRFDLDDACHQGRETVSRIAPGTIDHFSHPVRFCLHRSRTSILISISKLCRKDKDNFHSFWRLTLNLKPLHMYFVKCENWWPVTKKVRYLFDPSDFRVRSHDSICPVVWLTAYVDNYILRNLKDSWLFWILPYLTWMMDQLLKKSMALRPVYFFELAKWWSQLAYLLCVRVLLMLQVSCKRIQWFMW